MKTTGTVSAVLAQKGSEVWSITPEATVFEAIQLMASKNIGALLVMSGERLMGMISERDCTRRVALHEISARDVRVQQIMSTAVHSVTPNHTVEECMRLMIDQHVRHLPVLQEGKVVGVVSIGNLVNWIISMQSAAISHLEDYISGKYPG